MASDFRYRRQLSFVEMSVYSDKTKPEIDFDRGTYLANNLLNNVGACLTRSVDFFSRTVYSLYSAIQMVMPNGGRRNLTTAEFVEQNLMSGETKENILKVSQMLDEAIAFRNTGVIQKPPNIELKAVESKKRRKKSSDKYLFCMVSLVMLPSFFMCAFARNINETALVPTTLSRLHNANKYIVDMKVVDANLYDYEYRYNVTVNDTYIDEYPFEIIHDIRGDRPYVSFWIMDPLRLDEDGVQEIYSCNLFCDARKIKTKINSRKSKCEARIITRHGNNTCDVRIVPQEDTSAYFGIRFDLDSENFYPFRIKMLPDITDLDQYFYYRFSVSPDKKKEAKRKITLSLMHNATAHMLAYVQGQRKDERRKATACEVFSDSEVTPRYTFKDNLCDITLPSNSSLTQYNISLKMVHRRSQSLTLQLQLSVETTLPPVTEKPTTTEKRSSITEISPVTLHISTTENPFIDPEDDSRKHVNTSIYIVVSAASLLFIACGLFVAYIGIKNRKKSALMDVKVYFSRKNIAIKKKEMQKQKLAKQWLVDTFGKRALNLSPKDKRERRDFIIDFIVQSSECDVSIYNLIRVELESIARVIPDGLAGGEYERRLKKISEDLNSTVLTPKTKKEYYAYLLDLVIDKVTAILNSGRITVNTSVIDLNNKWIPNMWGKSLEEKSAYYIKSRKEAEDRLFIQYKDFGIVDPDSNLPLLNKSTMITRPVYGALDYKFARHGAAPWYGVHYYVIKNKYKLDATLVPGQGLDTKKPDEIFHWMDMEGLLISLMNSNRHQYLMQQLIHYAFYPDLENKDILEKYGMYLDAYIEVHLFELLSMQDAVEEFHVFTNPIFELKDSPLKKNKYPALSAEQQKKIKNLKEVSKLGGLPFKLFVDECEVIPETHQVDTDSQQDLYKEILQKAGLVELFEKEKTELSDEHIDFEELAPLSQSSHRVFSYTLDGDDKKYYMAENYVKGCIRNYGWLKCPQTNKFLYCDQGPCPNGFMSIEKAVDTAGNHFSLYDHEDCGTLKITYKLFPGLQSQKHNRPGVAYPAEVRVAYVPDNLEGRKVAFMLQTAFIEKHTFSVGVSRKLGTQDVVVWNDIHHKTSLVENDEYGYPDPNYLQSVKQSLKRFGIEEPVSDPRDYKLLCTVDNTSRERMKRIYKEILRDQQEIALYGVDAAGSGSSSPQPGPSGLQTHTVQVDIEEEPSSSDLQTHTAQLDIEEELGDMGNEPINTSEFINTSETNDSINSINTREPAIKSLL
ncbi:MAG: hypothetical protein KAG53_11265 [Endozoicomonadaceae bacterium]|nr:hypothetical protein [Endozoicomonadaceae bacterium]